jgi:hypothetical protein
MAYWLKGAGRGVWGVLPSRLTGVIRTAGVCCSICFSDDLARSVWARKARQRGAPKWRAAEFPRLVSNVGNSSLGLKGCLLLAVSRQSRMQTLMTY